MSGYPSHDGAGEASASSSPQPPNAGGSAAPRPGRYRPWSLMEYVCLDCGVVVAEKDTHDRFHAILNDHARAIAVLVNAHPDLRERAMRGHSGGWSAEAFAEVVQGAEDAERERTEAERRHAR